jgi:hypothetical protein
LTDPPSDRLCLLYIAGAGRSGSTILERILGNSPRFLSVGEVRYFWEYIASTDRLCGCGERLDECSFWQGVARTGDIGVEVVTRLAQVARRLDRTRNVPFLAAGYPRSRQFPREFLDWTRRLYEVIQHLAPGRVLVDSSKTPSHLNLLLKIPTIDVRVIHLVRDPRAYVYSESWRRKRDPRANGRTRTMRRLPVGAAVAAWIAENTFSGTWGRRAGGYSILQYESFAADPGPSIDRVLREVGLPELGIRLSSGFPLALGPTHSLSGNPSRLDRGPVVISEDREWRRAMPGVTQAILGAALWPWLLSYGYAL